MFKIYFAASIRGGREDKKIYFEIIDALKRYGEVLSEHFGNTDLTSQGEDLSSEFIRERDKNWVREADVIVAEVTTPSLGVGIELGWAEEWGKRVLCLYREQDGRRLSALVDGCSSYRVRRYQAIKDVQLILKEELG